MDGIPHHLPALLRTEKLARKARKADLCLDADLPAGHWTPRRIGRALFELAALAQLRGWSAEFLLRCEAQRQERMLRRQERSKARLADL